MRGRYFVVMSRHLFLRSLPSWVTRYCKKSEQSITFTPLEVPPEEEHKDSDDIWHWRRCPRCNYVTPFQVPTCPRDNRALRPLTSEEIAIRWHVLESLTETELTRDEALDVLALEYIYDVRFGNELAVLQIMRQMVQAGRWTEYQDSHP